MDAFWCLVLVPPGKSELPLTKVTDRV